MPSARSIPKPARAQAAARDAAIARGDDPGLLAGVPIGIKDLEPVKGMLFTEGSRAYEAASPGP